MDSRLIQACRVRLCAARTPTDRGAQGQTLVEFALVIPLFITVLLSIVEFAFIFNATLATQYASRDAALVAAEAGSGLGSDCVILAAVDADLGAPATASMIQTVQIYRTNAAGVQQGSPTIYARTGSFSCALPDGTTRTMPYTRTQDGYPQASRCNVIAGCGNPVASTRPLDHVGISVTYRYYYKTPIGLGFGTFVDIVRSNTMRMEPIL